MPDSPGWLVQTGILADVDGAAATGWQQQAADAGY